jgi:NADH:ubiquinone oxidoreductase subunit F (NADH-binding)/NADH:ubiquinone oxidoreductase subunit E
MRNRPSPLIPNPSPAADLVAAVTADHAPGPESILPVLLDLQTRHGHLTPAMLGQVARALHVPAERVHGVATFYSLLDVRPAPRPDTHIRARACDGPVCWLRGAAEARAALEAKFSPEAVVRSSCLGLCDRAPAALVDGRQVGHGLALDYAQARPGETRIMLARVGRLDPDSLQSALALGAYQSLARALTLPPAAVIDEVEASGLAGRGGAGFPAGRKWRLVAQSPGQVRYVVANADESEPLIFKDRVLMDLDPHLLLEGMALAGYAVGARQAYIYIRGEYAPQAARLETAITQALAAGWLGANILGSGFDFHIHVHRGAGAYICGEETALLESLEGRRGEPRIRPPFPAAAGYHGHATLVNNVETFCAVPAILREGAAWYRALGANGAPGTKLFMLLGHVNRPGLVEAPFGLTLRQLIDDLGGGLSDGSQFHFALTGGAAGTFVPADLLDLPFDYRSSAQGLSLGAGAVLVCDQSVSPVALLRELLHFFEMESCGKCTPCRHGTRQARLILDRLAVGAGRPGDAAELAALASLLRAASFCGLGQSAAMPIQSALRHFAASFEPKG